MSHHIATLHMNLPHEKWSKTAPIESSIENKLTNEEMARRKAVDARKEAERLRREAEQAKDAMEQRYRVRQQEKARFTDEQRAWWDSEVMHAKQVCTSVLIPAVNPPRASPHLCARGAGARSPTLAHSPLTHLLLLLLCCRTTAPGSTRTKSPSQRLRSTMTSSRKRPRRSHAASSECLVQHPTCYQRIRRQALPYSSPFSLSSFRLSLHHASCHFPAFPCIRHGAFSLHLASTRLTPTPCISSPLPLPGACGRRTNISSMTSRRRRGVKRREIATTSATHPSLRCKRLRRSPAYGARQHTLAFRCPLSSLTCLFPLPPRLPPPPPLTTSSLPAYPCHSLPARSRRRMRPNAKRTRARRKSLPMPLRNKRR